MEGNVYFSPDRVRIVTSGIREKVNPFIECYLWITLEEAIKNGLKPDHLQVFRLRTVRTRSKERLLLKITHSQEDPPYENRFSLPIEPREALEGTIWIIDDNRCLTMMWDSEY